MKNTLNLKKTMIFQGSWHWRFPGRISTMMLWWPHWMVCICSSFLELVSFVQRPQSWIKVLLGKCISCNKKDFYHVKWIVVARTYDAAKEESFQQEAKQRELQRIEGALQMAARRGEAGRSVVTNPLLVSSTSYFGFSLSCLFSTTVQSVGFRWF